MKFEIGKKVKVLSISESQFSHYVGKTFEIEDGGRISYFRIGTVYFNTADDDDWIQIEFEEVQDVKSVDRNGDPWQEGLVYENESYVMLPVEVEGESVKNCPHFSKNGEFFSENTAYFPIYAPAADQEYWRECLADSKLYVKDLVEGEYYTATSTTYNTNRYIFKHGSNTFVFREDVKVCSTNDIIFKKILPATQEQIDQYESEVSKPMDVNGNLLSVGCVLWRN